MRLLVGRGGGFGGRQGLGTILGRGGLPALTGTDRQAPVAARHAYSFRSAGGGWGGEIGHWGSEGDGGSTGG